MPSCRDSSRRLIARSDVFGNRSDPRTFLLAVTAWGHGLSGYGPARTRKILKAADASGTKAIDRVMTKLKRCTDMEAIWNALSIDGAAKLRGVGMAFGTKVAYFACYDRSTGSGPLIADQRSAWGFWVIDGSWDIRKSADLYARYIDTAVTWADDLGIRSDDIERAPFVVGPYARSIWNQERNRRGSK